MSSLSSPPSPPRWNGGKGMRLRSGLRRRSFASVSPWGGGGGEGTATRRLKNNWPLSCLSSWNAKQYISLQLSTSCKRNSPIKSTDYGSLPQLWCSNHVQDSVGLLALTPVSFFFLLKFLYDMFELGGFNSDTIPLGILHEQLVSLVKAIFGN